MGEGWKEKVKEDHTIIRKILVSPVESTVPFWIIRGGRDSPSVAIKFSRARRNLLRIIEAGRRQQVGDKSEIKVDTKTRESGMWNEGARGRRKGRAREYSRRAYRYATPSAINISGEEKKKDGRTWAGSKGTVAKVLSLAFTMKRRKGSPFLLLLLLFRCPLLALVSFPSILSLFLPSTPLFSYIPRTAWLAPDVEVHFIPTFNKASWPLQGFIKNWGCNLPRGPPPETNVL